MVSVLHISSDYVEKQWFGTGCYFRSTLASIHAKHATTFGFIFSFSGVALKEAKRVKGVAKMTKVGLR